MKPLFEGLPSNVGLLEGETRSSKGAAMREPIFYGGDAAYYFQYRDLAGPKYRADDEWLEANKGFRIDEVCQIADAIGRFQVERQLKSFKSIKAQPPDQWTMLPGFTFTAQDVARISNIASEKVERFLAAFSCGLDERNATFTALNEFNAFNSTPILRTGEETYLLLQHYSLLETIYESPFFWMIADKDYSPTALRNRGAFAEKFVAERLESVFGAVRILRNVDIYKGKNRFAEADVLLLYGDRAIVVQAKSKRLTIKARKGDAFQLQDDFKKAIQDAYDQAVLCAEAICSDGFKFKDRSGAEIFIRNKPRVIFPICVVSDHYPALAFQCGQFLKATVTESVQAPLVTDVFAFDVIAEMLNTPLHFLNFLSLRARSDEKLLVNSELTSLGFHLKQNLWFDSDYDMVDLGSGTH